VNTSNNNEPDKERKRSDEPLKSQRGRKDILSRLDLERSGHPTTTPAPAKCPPNRFVFIGNIPCGSSPSEVSEYLEDAVPGVKTPRVSLRSTHAGTHASMYAFMTLPSVELARKAIEFVRSTPFHGRSFSCSFARGHAVQTVTFVERIGVDLGPDSDVRVFDFDKCEDVVWDELASLLERFGDFEIIHRGKVRFNSMDGAKDAMRVHYLIRGREIIPVYDIDEQIPPLGPARPRNDRKEGFTLKSGRQGTRYPPVSLSPWLPRFELSS
jgi:hypothetical protein